MNQENFSHIELPQTLTHTENIGELMASLSKAQSKITSAVKSKKNPFFKSNYADLPSVWEACKDALSSNGLAVVQTIEGTSDQMYLTTILGHSSNQWIKSKVPLILAKKDPQSMGSCITYARRYSLMAMVGVCADDEDDDGEAATEPTRKTSVREALQELSKSQIEEYLLLWQNERGVNKEEFKEFMEEIIKSRQWSFKKCMEAFEKKPEYTLENFKNWKSLKSS